MIFRQLFDATSSTYTYLIAAGPGGEALIIDPVLERVERYVSLLRELDLRLVKAVDTHIHADHVTGLGALRDKTRCITVMGEMAAVDVVSMRVREGDQIKISGVALDVLYTPGHTDDSYSFLMGDRVFTGDTLLIRGTGRTDFQHGDPYAQYDSLFNKLLRLPDDTFVFPAHDYKGDTVSTIGEEKAFNPRLQVDNAEQYAEIMNGLNLADPKMMDVAVPANKAIGYAQTDAADPARALGVDELPDGGPEAALLIDLRDDEERARNGVIAGSVHLPYPQLASHIEPGGMLHYEATQSGKELVFYCAYGERSALAVDACKEAGLAHVRHLAGGMDAWAKAGRPVEK
jgi:glyoxylase-like metal-dependent hydrolase (beta-lactamase superfamily II)